VVVILAESRLSRAERYEKYYPERTPVDADVWVYTLAEWKTLAVEWPRLWERLQAEKLDLTRPLGDIPERH